MGTPWETLFHLSSFMKYLLIEVLPTEQLNSPKYVSESLLELLKVTLDCLNLIRNKNGPGLISHRSSFQAEIEKAATTTLDSYKSNKKENTNCINHHDSHNKSQDIEVAANNHNLVDYSLESSRSCSTTNPSITSVIKHNSTVISQNFINLSNDILTGNSFGYYCLPCDCTFTDEIKWESHCDNSDHITRIKKIKCAEFACKKCHLLVFGNAMIASIYIDFHSQETHKISNDTTSDPSLGIPNRIEKKPPVETNAVLNSRSVAVEDTLHISFNFEKIQSKMIRGFQKKGYYCNFCDEKFYNDHKWVEHFQKRELHNQKQQIISNGKFEPCEICSFTIFAAEDISAQLIFYHRQSHDLYSSSSQKNSAVSIKTLSESERSKDNLVPSASNIDRIGSVSRSTSKSEDLNTEDTHDLDQYNSSNDLSYNKKTETRNKKNTFVFTNTFLDVDDKIHSKNLVSAFYCRPCDEYCLLKDSEEHCLTGKHVNFVSSKNFKNFQAECTYCKFTIVGTDRTVQESMRFHAKGHNRVPSYSIEAVSKQGAIKTSKRRSRNKSSQITTSRNVTVNVELPNARDDSSVGEWDNETGAEFVQNEPRNDENSWYESSKEESFMSKLKELYMFRVKEKRSYPFAGYCVPCEFFIGSAFDWLDHLGSDGHCSIQSASDEELNLYDLNLRIFGNKSQIQNHSIL